LGKAWLTLILITKLSALLTLSQSHKEGVGMSNRRSKLNCWEFKNCGRQPQGHNVHMLGYCPASLDTRLDDTHDGVNGGRACWVVAGTFCGGVEQGTFTKKYNSCKECDFYRKVRDEEGSEFQLSVILLAKLTGDRGGVM
jgi:hypothetical protein